MIPPTICRTFPAAPASVPSAPDRIPVPPAPPDAADDIPAMWRLNSSALERNNAMPSITASTPIFSNATALFPRVLHFLRYCFVLVQSDQSRQPQVRHCPCPCIRRECVPLRLVQVRRDHCLIRLEWRNASGRKRAAVGNARSDDLPDGALFDGGSVPANGESGVRLRKRRFR